MTKTHGAWIWYELMSPDPEGAKAFYEAVVGWTMSIGHNGDNDYGVIANADGGMTGRVLRLKPDMMEHDAQPSWIGYIGVDDVDAMLVRVAAAGGKVLMPAFDIAVAGRVALVADCCGAPFYIMAPTPPPGGGENTAFSPTMLGRCGWDELCAGNLDHAVAFYTSLFGWSLGAPMDMGAHGQYQFPAHDGVPFGGMMKAMDHMGPPHWNHYFRVAGIDAAKAAAEANGGRIAVGPMQVPSGDWVVMGADSQGAFFALVGARG
jgi:predicted enzyme related to lactoylglutathione lyase